MSLSALGDVLSGRLLRVNDAFCRLVGLDAPTAFERGEVALTHPDDLPAQPAVLRRLATGEARSVASEKRCLPETGRPVPTWVRSAVVHDEQGRPSCVVTHAIDVSERVEDERQLQRPALTDTLIGLGNRTLVEDSTAARPGRQLASR